MAPAGARTAASAGPAEEHLLETRRNLDDHATSASRHANVGDGDGRGKRTRRLQGHQQWRVESTPRIRERIEWHYHKVTAFNAFETEMSGRVDSTPMVAERIDQLEHKVSALEQEFRDAKEFGDQLIQLQATVAMLSSLLPASSQEPREVSLHPITIR